MSFNPNENHSITLAAASVMTKAYRDADINSKIGGFFGKDAIQAILNQPTCVGLKFYFISRAGFDRKSCCVYTFCTLHSSRNV